jgi:hypothetical protein
MKIKMKVLNKYLVLFIFCSLFVSGYSQTTDTLKSIDKKRFNTLVIGGTTGYGLTLVGLHQLWYKNTEQQSFQFFNDNAEWKQVDKLGHIYSTFYFSYGTSKALQWCNVNNQKSAFWGSVTGFLIMLPIEIMDGFSAAYGASTGDLLANAAGSGLFLAQHYAWKEIRVKPKFSFHATKFASLRPNTLGDGFSELVKDYNGQTYWLSFDLDKFMRFPRWLNLAVGYGAEGMVYAREKENTLAGFKTYRQYYVAIDFDLSSIKTRSKVLNTIIFFADMIKLPAPTIEFSSKGSKIHPFYF